MTTREQVVQWAKESWLGDTVRQWFDERANNFAKFAALARADLVQQVAEQADEIERLTKAHTTLDTAWVADQDVKVKLRQQLTQAQAEIESLREDAEWQPIETAPKDGTDVLVMYMHIDTQVVHNAFWNDYEDADPDEIGWWSYDHSEVSRLKLEDWMTPTYWMPLPVAPKEK